MAFRISQQLLKGSIVLFISFSVFNFLNFVFHFSMVRMLTVADYGALASIFSMIYIFGIFSESIQLVITKYTAGEKENGKIKNILKRSLKKSAFVSVLLFGAYLLCAIPLSMALKIDYLLMAISGLILFSVFLSPVTRGVLQGTKRFKSLGVNVVFESAVKLALAIFFVYAGWRVYGAIIGTLVGTFLAFVFSFVGIKDIAESKERRADTIGIYGYTKPAFLVMFVVIAFYSLDVVFAKVFFSDVIAGAYAVASTLSKTIIFGTQPIGRAMFPLSAENKKNKNKAEKVFYSSLCMVLVISLAALALFYLIPELIIKVFSGKLIEEASSVLVFLGISVSLTSVSNLILLHKLSLGKVRGYKYLVLVLIIEALLFWQFSAGIMEFSLAYVAASFIFLIGSIILLRE